MHGELRKRPLDWLLALKIISRDHRPEESKRERERERTKENWDENEIRMEIRQMEE